MKVKVLLMILGAMLFCATLFANPKIFKIHKGKKGKNEAKINCVYCHSNAEIPKEKSNDIKAFLKGTYCASKDCH